ncbi:MAG: glutamine amidotransferase family protein [Candidatus Aenigmatarchaeota archaeon]
MRDLSKINNIFSDDKVIDSCSIFGMMNTKGENFSGKDVICAIANMHDRGNGLGGGFAIYGIYPEYKEYYALHIMFTSEKGKCETESFLKENFEIVFEEEIPHRKVKNIVNPPIVWRYFLEPKSSVSEDDYVVEKVMTINTQIKDAFVFSSGKNMGVFKGVGYPEEIAEFFELENYKGYIFTAHGRFPTNTQGWWGGAHPFSILDWTVVHNGEISSYGINKRYLEMFGYYCTMHTDTEVVAYAVDLLMRKQGIPIELVSKIFAPPFWSAIENMSDEEKNIYTSIRQIYGSLLLNGPFAVIIANTHQMIGLTDRIRLRPLVAGIKNDFLYISSEESAIRLVQNELDRCWIPEGGEPIIGTLKEGIKYKGAKM